MRIHYIYTTMFASLLAFTGCSNEADNAISNADKHPITLSVGADAPITRAVVTDGDGKTLGAFGSATDIWMVMQSDYVALSDDDLNFKGSTATTNCVTMGTTGDKTGDGLKENVVNFTDANTRYWDDAHARSSRLSIWAVAVPNVTDDASKWGTKTAGPWTTTIDADKTIAWEIPAAQSAESMKNKDLCFSNNIGDYSSASGADNRIKYGTQTSYHFDSGKLIFYHALSKITIKLVEGNGFDRTSDSDFNLSSITLNGFKLSGTFNVAEGTFTSQAATATPITAMAQKKTAEDITLQALVMPGAQLGGDSEALAFNLDGNAFSVKSETLAASLRTALGVAENATIPPLEAGKNYVFQFTVNKTGVKLIATIAKWDTVEGTNYSPLINITEVYGQERNEQNDFAKDFSFYLSESKDDSYEKGSDVTYHSFDKSYSLDTPLYWPNHNTHYFFRGIWPKVTDTSLSPKTPSGKVSESAIAVENCSYSSGTYPSDLMIALPRDTEDKTCPHGNKVMEQGICATEGEVRMNFQYVMSQIEVKLTTNTDPLAKDAVVFDENTTVEIVGGYTGGSILLMDGSANPTTKGVYTMHKSSGNDTFCDAIIPQDLENSDAKLTFRVTVKDGTTSDSYETVLGIKDIKVNDENIEKWEPGKHYVYNLYITKTGIKIIATIKNWYEAQAGTTIWM